VVPVSFREELTANLGDVVRADNQNMKVFPVGFR
jgi:hypothetical protein